MNSQTLEPVEPASLVISPQRFADVCARLERAEARARRSERRFRVAGGVLMVAVTLAVVAPVVSPAVAQGYGVTLATLNTRLTTAEGKITALQASDVSQQSAISDLKTRQQNDIAALKTSITSLQASDANQQSAIAALQASDASQQSAVADLQTKTASMSVLTDPNTGQPTVRFSNVNVQIVSGSGRTAAAANSRGNLIVGYNETRNVGDDRTGSHNLIVGQRNNYSSVGGVVFGSANTIGFLEPCILGGQLNTASGAYATISGGNGNTMNDDTINWCSSISGGYGNRIRSAYSTISGGQNITQTEHYAWSAGGDGGVGIYHTP